MAQFPDIEANYLLLPIFLLPLLYLIFKQWKYPFATKSPPIPPGPTPWPVLGNIPHMGRLPHVTLCNFAQTYGPLICLKLGTQYTVVGSSPAAAIEILKTHDRSLSARYVPKVVPARQEELNRSSIGWTEVCNDGWKYLRTLCRTELFSVRALDNQSCLREKKISDMVEHLRAKKEGQVVDIGELVFATIFNMLSNVMVSRDLIGLEEESAGEGMKSLVRTVMEVATAPNVSDFYPLLCKLDLQGLRKKSTNLGIKIRAAWEPIIEERRRQGAPLTLSQEDFLDTLLQNNFTNERIHQLLMELFTAGTDTSTSTIEWAMAELVKNPESMMKVREELGREINQDLPKESHLMQLPYLKACIKETFRLHPPAPLLLPHRAPEACQVMNYTIPKNAQVLVNVWAIGRDPGIWDEPLKFKPERFLSCSLDYKGNDFELLPFGSGRRICPGLPMAARHVPLVLASLIHCFDWSLPEGKDPQQLDMNEKFGVTLEKEQPLLLIPKARS
ncbi:probable (S)-N-methylcoclaurine 3'-hydroxylase isozyme 2 [Coffea eugenioides]|uniref:probable (S)-N-methylcoclaurine 3'-hydroxylase isozyme 2 n=1 Tax=Coffea eugenioides TaxID=49369 RepID=UPI000F613AC7|nr:probable (S)-N-methylcoclaurine 3'-hydroxylase isozyme 2 [Coffea eugenioides]